MPWQRLESEEWIERAKGVHGHTIGNFGDGLVKVICLTCRGKKKCTRIQATTWALTK